MPFILQKKKKKLMSAALLARIQNLIEQGENKMSWEYVGEESLFTIILKFSH